MHYVHLLLTDLTSVVPISLELFNTSLDFRLRLSLPELLILRIIKLKNSIFHVKP